MPLTCSFTIESFKDFWCWCMFELWMSGGKGGILVPLLGGMGVWGVYVCVGGQNFFAYCGHGVWIWA